MFRGEAIESYLPEAFCRNLFYGKVDIIADYDFLCERILPIIAVQMVLSTGRLRIPPAPLDPSLAFEVL